jgi:hypothetical protein
MPDAKLTALPIGTPARNALLYVVTDPNGSPLSQLLSVADVLGLTNFSDVQNVPAFIVSDPSGIPGAVQITNNVVISQADYDALGSYDPNTIYDIVG